MKFYQPQQNHCRGCAEAKYISYSYLDILFGAAKNVEIGGLDSVGIPPSLHQALDSLFTSSKRTSPLDSGLYSHIYLSMFLIWMT